MVSPHVVAKFTQGVPQGSILGPLMFCIYINDFVDLVQANIQMFADDTSLYLNVDNPVAAAEMLNYDLSYIYKLSNAWLVTFNALKINSILILRNTNPPN